jgi:shikimate kinase
MRVFLVGFMGAGKTTTGHALARELRALFWDLDARVEAVFRMAVTDIFQRFGEPAFRAEESHQLAATAAFAHTVVATGGGTFASPENRDLVRAAGVSVFLDVPWEELSRRLPGKRDERPLFTSLERAFELYSGRLASYRLADLVVRPDASEGPELFARRIATLLRQAR